jgi:hypothetical protein
MASDWVIVSNCKIVPLTLQWKKKSTIKKTNVYYEDLIRAKKYLDSSNPIWRIPTVSILSFRHDLEHQFLED